MAEFLDMNAKQHEDALHSLETLADESPGETGPDQELASFKAILGQSLPDGVTQYTITDRFVVEEDSEDPEEEKTTYFELFIRADTIEICFHTPENTSRWILDLETGQFDINTQTQPPERIGDFKRKVGSLAAKLGKEEAQIFVK